MQESVEILHDLAIVALGMPASAEAPERRTQDDDMADSLATLQRTNG